jgi:hypothetical protein
MLRDYTDINDGAPTAVTLLACSAVLQYQLTVRGPKGDWNPGPWFKVPTIWSGITVFTDASACSARYKKYCGDFDPLCGRAHPPNPEQLASPPGLSALQCMLQPLTRRPSSFLQCRLPDFSSDRKWQLVYGACRAVHEGFYGRLDQNGNPARSATAMVEKPALGKRLSIRSPHPLAAKCIVSVPVF